MKKGLKALPKYTNFQTGPLTDDKLIVLQVKMSFIDWEENTKGKGENAVYQHFLLFPTVFSKVLFPLDRSNSGLCGKVA